jgi:hypothetical protein
MSDASMSNQANEPDQSIASSQQAQPHASTSAAGSALLDANAASGKTTDPQGEPVAAPIATNFSRATAAGETDTVTVATNSESNFAGQDNQETGKVHPQADTDVASDQIQEMPDADPAQLPIDSEVNLPD